MSKIQTIQFKNFKWIDILHPGEPEIEQLRQQYKFHPLDLQDCISPVRRNKIDMYDEYTFLVLLWPYFNRQTKEILTAELDIFIGKDFLITLHHGQLKVFQETFDVYRISSDMREKHSDPTPERLLYEILNRLYLYVFPMIDHLIEDTRVIERAIFSGQERRMIHRILQVRRNILDFRQIMQVHKNIQKRLIINLKENEIYAMKKTDAYFESLLEYTKEVWDQMENLKEQIEAMQDTNESQINFRMSDIMRVLTIISVITFPITLMAAIFGMNTVHSMPFIDNPHGFWIILGLMVTIVISMIAFFKAKRWM